MGSMACPMNISFRVMPEVMPDCAKGKVVVAHLGNGASMCAIDRGQSIAATMGFTAVDGLPMGTRTGALDPGVILYLLQHERMDAQAIEQLIYLRSGLLGVSGISNDMRTLLASSAPAAREAVDLFVYRIGRELGSLAAALGGLDALVFTAGIGEHSAEIRARVLPGRALARRHIGREGQCQWRPEHFQSRLRRVGLGDTD